MRAITFVNQSSVVNDADFAAAVAACQRQVNEHFGPAWGGLVAALSANRADPSAPHTPTVETIYVLDTSDQAGALGYHEMEAGVPVGFVFAKTSEDAAEKWQVTLSHELLEQIADPNANTCAVVTFRGKTAAIEYEVCDPVEETSYLIDGVPVSNFVLPAWFQSASPGAVGPFDYLRVLKSPLQIATGGYVGYTYTLRRWQEVSARTSEDAPKKYHRKNRRRECPTTSTGKRQGSATRPVGSATFVGGKAATAAKQPAS